MENRFGYNFYKVGGFVVEWGSSGVEKGGGGEVVLICCVTFLRCCAIFLETFYKDVVLFS